MDWKGEISRSEAKVLSLLKVNSLRLNFIHANSRLRSRQYA